MASVRKAALERISDLAILQQVLIWDEEQTLREYVSERLCQLLSGDDGEAPSVTARVAALEQMSDPKILGHILVKGDDANLPQDRRRTYYRSGIPCAGGPRGR